MTLSRASAVVVALPILIMTAALPFPAGAQVGGDEGVCVAGTTSDERSPLMFVVQAEYVTEFEARGFAVEPCAGREARSGDFRQSICQIAQNAPEEIKNNFKDLYRFSPEELCAMVFDAGN